MLENNLTGTPILYGEIQRQVLNLGKEEQHKVVEPQIEDVEVLPDSLRYALGSVLVKGVTAKIDENIKPENIKLGTTILGVEGNVAPDKPDQEKTIYPSEEEQIVVGDIGFELAKVIAKPVETESFEITPSTSEQIVKATDGKYIKEVKVGAIEDIEPEIAEQEEKLESLGVKVDELPIYEPITDELEEQANVVADIESQVDSLKDISDETLDITENGEYEVVDYGKVNVKVVGSGIVGDGEYFVKVIDYDGTILKEAWLDTGDTFELPIPPSHDGLVFQEWSCSQDIVDNVVTVTDNNVMAGAVYTTASGVNEFDIEITKAVVADIETNGFVVTLNMDGTKDWGDGASDDSITHTYYAYGKYTIRCNGTTMTTSSSSGLFAASSKDCCVNVRFASVDGVGTYAFSYHNSLTSVIMSKNVESIGSNAFNQCKGLTGVVIPNGVTIVSDYAFQGCDGLTSVVMPNSVTSINSGAFYTCVFLTNTTIPNSVTYIGGEGFSGCYSLNGIVIPQSVSSMGYYVFDGCRSLTKATILSNYLSGNTYWFSYCTSLRTVTINGLQNISNYMFNECNSLKNITILSDVYNIYNYAFSRCLSLTSIKMPSKLNVIHPSAFAQCVSMTTYDFSDHTHVPTLSNTNAFFRINPLKTKIIVPDNLYDEWIAATNWVTYANYIYKASEVQA